MSNLDQALDMMEESGTPRKKMYRVEKFLPPECPKCRHKFQQEGQDWCRLLGDIVNGEKVIRETKGYYIIRCTGCDNYTALFPIEEYQLSSKEEAEKLMREQGFVNLLEVTAMGSHTRDMHIVHNKESGLRVEAVKCEAKDG